MSLPTVTKDISEHLPKTAVAAPVNKANKEAAVDRKDVRDVIEAARVMVERKNADELFQNFVWSTHQVDLSGAKKDPNEVLPVDGNKVQQDKELATKHFRTLLNLIVTNSEALKLLSDFSVVGRDVLARGATHDAGMIRPDQDRLQNVDQSAPSDQSITTGGRPAGPNETPVAEASIPGVNGAVMHIEKDGQKYSVDKAKQTAIQRGQETDNMLDRVPQEHKDNTQGKFEEGKRVLSEEYFPEERRDQFIYHGKKVIVECQRHDHYQESIKWLLAVAEEYAGHGRHVAAHGKDTHSQVTSDSGLQTSWTQLRTLLECFANNESMDPAFNAANDLIDDARNDQEFRD
ncbi:hypothetical protein PENSPDRAFT_676112 [Peniophora sp. CONT]|nr:hypothetical protein PENSPDRAFT_676112 [Peniophora sp. CONT]